MSKEKICPLFLMRNMGDYCSSELYSKAIKNRCVCIDNDCAWFIEGFPSGCAVKVGAENLEGRRR